MQSSKMRTIRSSWGGHVSQHAPGRGVCVSQHALGKGVSVGGCLPSACWDTDPLVDNMTDACENSKSPFTLSESKRESDFFLSSLLLIDVNSRSDLLETH